MILDIQVRLSLRDIFAPVYGRTPRVEVIHCELDRYGFFVSPTGKRITPMQKLERDRSLDVIARADEILVGNPGQGWILYKSRRWPDRALSGRADRFERRERIWPE